MHTIPTDSTDAREQRETEAELTAAEELEQRRHDVLCRGGWMGLDADERPIPCPRCRPHLLQVACRTCTAPAQSCTHLTTIRRGPCCEECNHCPARTDGSR